MANCVSCRAPLPPEARFCPACATPVGGDADRSERKLATILFADLVGSTALGASQDPERTRATLERFYDAMAEEIDHAGGTVEKFAGDAVMSAFGAPAALEDHVERALHAALAMHRRLRSQFDDRLALRIGIDSGEVVVGSPREGSSFVTGDAVNAAARLEQAAGPGETMVGERAVASVRGAFEFDQPQVVEAKGFPDGLPARRLLRALSLMRPRGVQSLNQAFVGRDGEMDALESAYESAQATGSPRLVTIIGDAGVGKSRLVREFWERLGARQPEPLRRTGRCLAYGQGTTYWPLAEVLKEHLGITDDESPSAVLDRLGPRAMLGMTLGLDVAGSLHPLVARDQLQDAWTGFVEDIAAERPVVMLIEDIHWAEDLLLDLLERVLGDARAPLLLVVTARPEVLERRPRWGAGNGSLAITLEPLAADESTEMLADLLGVTPPAELRGVMDRAEGNPFFVEELLGTLIDRKFLVRQNGTWQLAELPADFHVPDTVQAVVAARIDLLETAEKQALQAAAVIGRIFWAEPVYALVSEAPPDLRVLEDRDFIRRRLGSSMAGQREYAIKHALTREVAYDSIPRSRRAGLHAGFARWVEATAGSPDEVAPILAHHYAEAVRPEDLDLAWPSRDREAAEIRTKAIGWLQRAAQLAIGRMEIDDAIGLLHRALALETDPVQLASIWREVGRASNLKFDGEGFWTAMQASLELDSDPATSADVYGELAIQTTSRRGMWMRRPTNDLIENWIARALDLAERGSPAQAKALISRALLTRDEGLATEAAGLAEALDDTDLRSLAWHGLEWASARQGNLDRAYAWSRRQVDLVPAMTDPDRISYILGDAAGMSSYVGRIAEARELAERDLETSRRLSPHHRLHGISSVVFADVMGGRWRSVRELTSDAESAFDANRATPCMLGPIMLLACAEAAVHGGDQAESARLQQVATEFGMEGYSMWSVPAEVALATARGDLATLEERLADWRPEGLDDVEGQVAWLNALIALDRRPEIELDAPALVLPGTYLEPFALRALAYARRDAELWQRSIAEFEAMDLDWFAAETRKMADASAR